MGRKTRWWLAATLSVGVAVALILIYVRGERDSVEHLRYWSDIAFLDDYADELSIVMSRAWGDSPEPEQFARRVDGPGPDIEALELSGSAYDEGITVVMRLRRHRPVRQLLPSGEPEMYEISACYRWLYSLNRRGDDPERLAECPDRPVIHLGPPPVAPDLPPGLHEVLEKRLSALVAGGDPVTEAAVAETIRSLYAELERKALAKDDVEPEEILNGKEILAGDDWIVTIENDIVGVAVGRQASCVVARVEGEDVAVWTPDRMVLLPGEAGCSASWAAHQGLA